MKEIRKLEIDRLDVSVLRISKVTWLTSGDFWSGDFGDSSVMQKVELRKQEGHFLRKGLSRTDSRAVRRT